MGFYIKMPVDTDGAYTLNKFKARYEELTRPIRITEKMVKSPDMKQTEQDALLGERIFTGTTNTDSKYLLAHSTRLTQEISDQLVSEFPNVEIAKTYPESFVRKIDDII